MIRWVSGLAVIVLLLLAACARFPADGGVGAGPRLTFTMDVDGVLRTGLLPGEGGQPYVYIIALRLSTLDSPIDEGPLPVVVPGGNGFVAGNATHFILWDPLVSPQFRIFQFQDELLNESTFIGTPQIFTAVNPGDRRLTFTVELTQLVGEAAINDFRSVQVNFLTMNNTNVSGGGRLWDALGDSRIPSEINSFVTLSLLGSGVFNPQTTGLEEPRGDVVDPDLDITFWQVEIVRP